MVFCYAILAVLVSLILASKSIEITAMDKVAACILAFMLAVSIFVLSAFVEEKGKATALRAVGWREYTKSELYVVSDMEKDKLPKTYDFIKGTVYWRIDEQDTK